MAGRPKGYPKTGGRARGTPNKITTDLREMILTALDRAGGARYLEKQANENPAAYLALLGRLVPKDVNLSAGGGLENLIVEASRRLAEQSK